MKNKIITDLYRRNGWNKNEQREVYINSMGGKIKGGGKKGGEEGVEK